MIPKRANLEKQKIFKESQALFFKKLCFNNLKNMNVTILVFYWKTLNFTFLIMDFKLEIELKYMN